LSFRGDEEQFGSAKNGNFLRLLELLAQFDPFLKAHIEKNKNKGKGNVYRIYQKLSVTSLFS